MTESFSDSGFRSALALLADEAPEPRVTALVAADEAWAAARRSRTARTVDAFRRRPALVRPVLVAVAAAVAAVILLTMSVLVPLGLTTPDPAGPTPGPGALPDRVFVVPPWTPSVTKAPIARAAYLVKTQERNGSGVRAALVSADDGSYRQVPVPAGDGVLSRDGRRLGWVEKPGLTRTSLAVLSVLDLPTGHVRRLAVEAGSSVDTTIDGLAIGPDGARLTLWGSRSTSPDGASGEGMLAVVEAGPIGDDAALQVTSACYSTCFGPVAWLDDGRLAYAEGGPDVAALRGVTGAASPADPRDGFGTNLPLGARLTVDGTGSTRYLTQSQGGNGEAPQGRPYWLLATNARGATQRMPLGTAQDAGVLGVVRDGALVVLVGPTAAGHFGDGRVTVERVTPSGRVVVTSAQTRALVTGVAGEVAEGGATVRARGTGSGITSRAWWSWHAAMGLLGLGAASVLGLLMRALVGPARRRRRRRS